MLPPKEAARLFSDPLLASALRSLEPKPKTRQDIFTANRAAIEALNGRPGITVKHGALQFKPSVGGEIESQRPLPLVVGETYAIDTRRLSIEGGESLQTTIGKLCRANNIIIPSATPDDFLDVTFLSTVVAGQHAEADTLFTGITAAELAPVVFNDPADGIPTRREFITSFPLVDIGGSPAYRVDPLFILRSGSSLSGIGRRGNNKTHSVVEIPNAVTATLHEERPEVFKKLQQQGVVVLRLQYKTPSDTPIDSAATRGGDEFRSRGAAKGLGSGLDTTRSLGWRAYRGGDEDASTSSRGVSQYAVVGAGSAAHDTSVAVSEVGPRTLEKVYLTVVAPLVFNNGGVPALASQYVEITEKMRMRAEELSKLPVFTSAKAYKYTDLCRDLNAHAEHFGVTITTDIFEHTLLRLADITVPPGRCVFDESKRTPEYMFVDFGLDPSVVGPLVENLQTRFGADFCQYTPQFNKEAGLQAVRFSLIKLSENMPTIRDAMTAILSDERSKTAYQRYTHKRLPLFHETVAALANRVRELGISGSRTNCIETVLLKMFGCNIEPHRMGRSVDLIGAVGIGYVSQMLDSCVSFRITEPTAHQWIAAFNHKYPGAAVLTLSNPEYCTIQVDNRVLLDPSFLTSFQEVLLALAEEKPFLIDAYRVESGVQARSTAEYVEQLKEIASHYTAVSGEGELSGSAKEMLKTSLKDLADVATDGTRTARRESVTEVRKAFSFFKSRLDDRDYRLLRDGDKKQYNEVRDALLWVTPKPKS